MCVRSHGDNQFRWFSLKSRAVLRGVEGRLFHAPSGRMSGVCFFISPRRRSISSAREFAPRATKYRIAARCNHS